MRALAVAREVVRACDGTGPGRESTGRSDGTPPRRPRQGSAHPQTEEKHVGRRSGQQAPRGLARAGMDLPGAIADDSGMSGGGSKKSSKLGALGRALGDAFTGGLVRDLRGARSIALRPHKLPAGADCLLAPDLMCQHVAPDGTVLATRG